MTADSRMPEVDDPVVKQICQLCPEAADEEVLEALRQDRPCRENRTPPAARVSLTLRMWSRLKAVAMLWLMLCVSLPLSIAGILLALFDHHFWRQNRTGRGKPPGSLGTALVSGGNKGKSLAVVRHLHRAGWRVVLLEVHTGWGCAARFSNCVSAFYSTPRPNTDPVAYLKTVAKVAAKERVGLWVPVSMAQYSVYEALACSLMPPGTTCCTTDPHMTAVLNDKVVFTAFAKKHGLSVPDCFPVTSKAQLLDYNRRAQELFKGRRFLLKSVAYEPISRADLFTLPCSHQKLERYIRQYTMTESQPWLLQTFLQGPELSCYTLAHEGQVVAHVDNIASLSCLNYAHVGNPEVRKWVEDFCKKTGASGQLCFDFMYDKPNGTIFCIEANPRTSTNLMAFYNHPQFATAYYKPQALIDLEATPLLPLATSLPSYWVWNEIGEVFLGWLGDWRLLANLPSDLLKMVDTLRTGRDAVFDIEDPVPFLALHYLQMVNNLLRVVWLGTPWLKLDLCSGKVVEAGGD